MQFDRCESMIRVKATLLTPAIMVELQALLIDAYEHSGKHVDERQTDGRLVRNLIKPYDALLYRLSEDAEAARNHLIEKKISGVKILGCFMAEGVYIPSVGDSITIAKGVPIRSTHPAYGRNAKPNGRCRKVVVASVMNGLIKPEQMGFDFRAISPEITWVGSGGYWHRAYLNDLPVNCTHPARLD